MKRIEITVNDNTKQTDIDYLANKITELLDDQGITGVILVHVAEDKKLNAPIYGNVAKFPHVPPPPSILPEGKF